MTVLMAFADGGKLKRRAAAGRRSQKEGVVGVRVAATVGENHASPQESRAATAVVNVNLVTKSTVSHLAGETSRISRFGFLGTPSSR